MSDLEIATSTLDRVTKSPYPPSRALRARVSQVLAHPGAPLGASGMSGKACLDRGAQSTPSRPRRGRSSHATSRSDVVPPPAAPAPADDKGKPKNTSKYISWSELLRRTFGIEVVCTKCKSQLHTIAVSDYTPAQLEAWAPARPDVDRWTMRMQTLRPFVVEEDGKVLGYADLQANGHIDHLYVSGASARRGVGRLLMERIHARAQEMKLARLFSDVSRTGQPFFERFGFLVIEHKTVVVGGVSLANARMTKDLLTGGEETVEPVAADVVAAG